MEKEEKPKKVAVLDGVTTRVLLDMSQDYIKNNPLDFVFKRKKGDVIKMDLKCINCGSPITSKEDLFKCQICEGVFCIGCVDVSVKDRKKFVCDKCKL